MNSINILIKKIIIILDFIIQNNIYYLTIIIYQKFYKFDNIFQKLF